MVERRLYRNFDIGIVLLMLSIVIYGLVVVYSASRGGPKGASYVHKQIMWAVAGLLIFALMVSLDHKSYPRLTRWIYAINISLLIAVLIFGKEVNGAKSWFGIGSLGIQPSEFAKLAVIICLAVFLAKNRDQLHEFRIFALSFGLVAVPLILVLAQPDLGTSLVITSIWFGMVFAAGARAKHLILFVSAVAALALIGWFGPTLASKYLGVQTRQVFKEYQKKRLTSFLNPEVDPRASGFHIIQARIAVGSGQATGKGYLHGTQGQLGFIPERNTDFIFTVVAEELGFVGAGFLLLLYFSLLWKGLVIASETEDTVGRLTIVGIVSMFLYHIVQNVGMTIGIMPVTGVPLPLFSYGGSNLLVSMMALGLLVGIGMRRHKINF
jgi:rod shape determining protein RodA